VPSNSHTFTISQTGNYRVKAEIYVASTCNAGWVLNEVDYTDDRWFYINTSATASGTINGQPPSVLQVNRLCSADDITLINTSSGTGSGNNTFGYQHRLLIKKVTPLGGGNFMTLALGYDSGWQNGNPGSFNLRNLSGPNGNYLDSNSGNFLVELQVKNNCTSLPISAGDDGYTQWWLELVPQPNSIDVNFVVNKSQPGNLSSCYSQTLPGCPTGQGSPNIDITSSGPIDEYDIKIIEVDCNTGVTLSPTPLYNGTFTGQPNTGTLPSNISLNGLPINGQTLYFTDDERVGECFKLTVRIRNICETIERWSYFIIEGGYRPADPGLFDEELSDHNSMVTRDVVYPNPTSGNMTLELAQAATSPLQIEIRNAQGMLLMQQTAQPSSPSTTLTVPTAQLPPGLYTLRLVGTKAKPITFRKE